MRPDRHRDLDASAAWDVVVIGAGLGGLSAAALLAKAGKKVLVLDQHYVAGGNATEFRRKDYVFDVGVHYLGACGPGGTVSEVLREADVQVHFLPMDAEGFDTLCFPDGMRFAYPRGLDAFERRLLQTFPGEARGIRKYCRFLRGAWRLMEAEGRPRALLLAIPRSLQAVASLNRTLEEVLDRCTRNPRLRAVLCGPVGDHGIAPSRVSALLHAGLVMHYLHQGAFYPQGGGQVMADRLCERVEAHGGKVLLLARVRRILVEEGRAAGVVFTHPHLKERTVRAPVVISNADLKRTYAELLPPGAVPAAATAAVADYVMAPGLAVLYLGARREVFGEHPANTNYWVLPGDDVEAEHRAIREGQFSEKPGVFLTLSSLKDPGRRIAPEGVMNLQVMCLTTSSRSAWGATDGAPDYRASSAYQEAKAAMRDRLLARAETVFPGLRAAVTYEELATPLTQARFTLASNGTPYGIAGIPSQFNAGRPAAQTELPGLLIAGASARSGHGVVGALVGGRAAARAVLEAEGRRRVWGWRPSRGAPVGAEPHRAPLLRRHAE